MRITRAPVVLVFAGALLAASPAVAAEYYVSTEGDDDNPGTEAEPFATVGRGQLAAAPGDTVWVRGGTYSFSSGTVGVAFTKAGQAGESIQYFAYADEVPVFDLSGIAPSGRVTGGTRLLAQALEPAARALPRPMTRPPLQPATTGAAPVACRAPIPAGSSSAVPCAGSPRWR